MAQVTIYMDNDLESKVKDAAAILNLSISKFIANTLAQNIDNEWDSSIKALPGKWSDFPNLQSIRATEGKDLERESF